MIIDLTHRLLPGIPTWPGDPELALAPVAGIDIDGWYLQRVSFGEHTGTHIGVAAHMTDGGITVDMLPAELLIRPAVVFDVRGSVERDAGYLLQVSTIDEWEEKHGRIEHGSIVLLNTGWDRYWEDEYFTDMYPGYSLNAAQMLAEERGVVALGIDTAGIDGGADATFGVNRYWLSGERYHLENLTALEKLPSRGATIFVGALPIAGGSGSPVRVLGVV